MTTNHQNYDCAIFSMAAFFLKIKKKEGKMDQMPSMSFLVLSVERNMPVSLKREGRFQYFFLFLQPSILEDSFSSFLISDTRSFDGAVLQLTLTSDLPVEWQGVHSCKYHKRITIPLFVCGRWQCVKKALTLFSFGLMSRCQLDCHWRDGRYSLRELLSRLLSSLKDQCCWE